MQRNKVVLIGDSSVGKSSISIRLCKNKFNEWTDSTIGAAYSEYRSKEEIVIGLWDTAGQERYNSLIPMYLNNAIVIILVFDLTNKVTFTNAIKYWIPFVNREMDNPIIYLLGNKNDKVDKDSDDYIYLDNCLHSFLCSTNNKVKYFETSAKTGFNVVNVFEDISQEIKEYNEERKEELNSINTYIEYLNEDNCGYNYCCQK